MIRKAEIKDYPAAAALATRMWEHDPEELIQEWKEADAARLLSACENWAKEKGCREFASDCELTNTDSQKFHLSLGFQEANRVICFTKKL